MKKQSILLLSSLLLLSACTGNDQNNSSSSENQIAEDFSFATVLNKLSKGYALDVLRTSQYKVTSSGNTTTYNGYQTISSDGDSYRVVSYEEVTDGNPSMNSIQSDIEYSNDNGNLVSKQLTIENKVESAKTGKKWSSSFLKNAFAIAKEDDFSKDGNVYALDITSTSLRVYLEHNLIGYEYSNESLKALSLTLNDDKSVSFFAEFEPYTVTMLTEISISISFEGKFTNFGNAIEEISPINKEESKTFSDAMKKLSALNFKTTVRNSEILYKDGRYEVVATAEGEVSTYTFSYKFYDENNKLTEDALYYKDGNKVQRVALYDEDKYVSGQALNASLNDFWPSYKISSVFFDENNGSFVLNKKYGKLLSSTSYLTPFVADTIEDLTITITDEAIKVVASNSGNGLTIFGAKEEIEFTSFGEVKDQDISNVNKDCSSLTWTKAIRSDAEYASLVTELGGTELLDKIPYFGGVYSEAGFESSSAYPYLYTKISSLAEGNALLQSYTPKLLANGFKEEKASDGTDYVYSTDKAKLTIAPFAFEETSILTGQGTGRYYFALIFSLEEIK